MNFTDVYAFKKVASTRSFTKAARLAGCSRSAISKQISRLEQELGVVLVNRTTRTVTLTEAGRTLDQQTADLDTRLEKALDIVRASNAETRGNVTFTLPSAIGTAILPSLMQQFRREWPDVVPMVDFIDGYVDVMGCNYDVAIVTSQGLEDSSMVSRRLATSRMVLAASPDYLEQYGVPRSITELAAHRCLDAGGNSSTNWRLVKDGEPFDLPVESAAASHSELAVILAASQGNGIVYVPEICIAGELMRNSLKIVLEAYADTSPVGVYAIYPHRNIPRRVRLLVDYLEQLFTSLVSPDTWAPLSSTVSRTARRSRRKSVNRAQA